MGLGSFIGGSVVLPVAAWVVQVLHLVTLTTHIAVMTILLGSSLLYAGALLFFGKEPFGVPRLPVWMAFAINSGVAPLLFCQALLAHFIYTSSILMAGWWLGSVFLLMAAYYLSYLATSTAPIPTRRWAAVLTASLLLFVSFVFVCNMDLMAHPERWDRYGASPHGWILFTGGVETLLRWAHVVMAALFHALLLGRIFGHGSLSHKKALLLGGIFLGLLGATGLAHYTLLSEGVRHAAGQGVINLLPVLLSAALLMVAFMGGYLKFAGFWAMGNLTMMVLFREKIRQALLVPAITTGSSDYGSFVMFSISLAVGLAAFGCMFYLVRKKGEA